MEDSMRQRLEVAIKRLAEIDEELSSENVMKDLAHFRDISKERANLDPQVETYNKYKKNEEEIAGAREMANDSDPEISEMGKEEVKRLTAEQEELEVQLKELLLPKDPNDDKNIIVEIRGAVGGDEANIFAGDLFRMYTRYAESQGWKIQLLDESPSESGGFALVSFKISGKMVYSKLKFESGAHRVQRVPKTEAAGRIHTSTATVLVMPEAEELDFELDMSEVRVDITRSSGCGGQGVNTTDSAVRLTHIPTGIVVIQQDEKSQIKNKEKAFRVLRARLFDLEESKKQAERAAARSSMVGSGARSEKIRTYNFPQDRVTDHRINLSLHNLPGFMMGNMDDMLDAMNVYAKEEQLAADITELGN